MKNVAAIAFSNRSYYYDNRKHNCLLLLAVPRPETG